ncbi:hypothetical protein ACXHQ9_09140 [Vibrio cincinnatiensis]
MMGTTEPEVLKALSSGTANDSSGSDSLSNMSSKQNTELVERKMPLWFWVVLAIIFFMWSRI